MNEDEQFLRAILAAPDDVFARLVYADWLDDRGDPRAEYLRLRARAADLPLDSNELPALRKQVLALQTEFPSWWLAIVGFRALAQAPRVARIEEAARVLKRPVMYTDAFDYEIMMHAAVIGATGCVAYLESRSKEDGGFQDIRYDLRLRDLVGKRAAVCEPYTYNPYFGCDPQFFEWYGDVALLIYREKRTVQVCRFGFDNRPVYREASQYWLLNGRELVFRGYGEQPVRRLSLPDLAELPPLSEADARARELWPE